VPRFEDYHRTVIGYHGTRRSVALEIVQGNRDFSYSRNRDDWLGHGIYFWEHAPQQAWWWAERRRRRRKWDEEVAVLGSMIRLGNCFDLLDPAHVKYLESVFQRYQLVEQAAGRQLLENANNHKYLDCAVFQYAYANLEAAGKKVDSSRAVYVPTGKDKRVWKRSWINRQAHIQICVRDPACILGTWLVKPAREEGLDDGESSQETAAGPDVPQDEEGVGEPGPDVDGGADPAAGGGGTDDPGRGGSG
jgi:hypothetical protein